MADDFFENAAKELAAKGSLQMEEWGKQFTPIVKPNLKLRLPKSNKGKKISGDAGTFELPNNGTQYPMRTWEPDQKDSYPINQVDPGWLMDRQLFPEKFKPTIDV